MEFKMQKALLLSVACLSGVLFQTFAPTKAICRGILTQPAKTTSGYYDLIDSLKASGVSVGFPLRLPYSKAKLYAWTESADTSSATPDTTSPGKSDQVLVFFDTTPDCHGAHYCSLGTYSVSDAKPEQMMDRHGQIITRKLRDGSLFTPEHSMGDTFPAQIQWQANGHTYSFSWAGLQTGAARTTLQIVKSSVSSKIP